VETLFDYHSRPFSAYCASTNVNRVSACNSDGLYVPPTNEAVLTPLIDSMLESKNLDDSCKPSIAEPINDLACCLLPVKKNALALEHPLPW